MQGGMATHATSSPMQQQHASGSKNRFGALFQEMFGQSKEQLVAGAGRQNAKPTESSGNKRLDAMMAMMGVSGGMGNQQASLPPINQGNSVSKQLKI
jgi:hypothetical protein